MVSGVETARVRHRRGADRPDPIRIAHVENTELADLETAASIGLAFPDQRFSIVDRTSWSVMMRVGVHEAIAFDGDYSVVRFGRERRLAFVVHS